MLLVLDAVEKQYAPETQTKSSEGPTTITNSARPDSAVKKDSGKNK
jgi:hypothetical protein